jgi:hypothetical protein
LISVGAAAVSSREALGWQPVKAKPAREALNRTKVGRCLFTAGNLTASLVNGKAGKGVSSFERERRFLRIQRDLQDEIPLNP